VYSDDGAKLTVNGQPLINDLETQGAYTRSGTITLTAGQKYNIDLQFAEGGGDAFCHLEWESLSQQREIVPQAQLYSRPASTTGPVTVYENTNYGGFYAGLPIGTYKLAGLQLKGILNDEISSLKIAEGYKVILFEHENFLGDSIVLTSDNASLGTWDEKVSSIKVLANGVTTLAGSYNVKNVNSNLFLDIRGGLGGVGDGVPVQLWTGTNAANQVFTFKHLGDGRYTITAYHSAKSLDVAQSDTSNNANVWQWTNLAASNQQFIAVAVSGGYYKFINVLSGKVLSTLNESIAPEAKVVQFTNINQASAKWALISVPNVGNGTGLTGNYFNGQNFETPVFSRIDPTIDFDWGNGSPGTGINADGNSIRWLGKIEPRYTGEYTFYITSDNGRRLWINNQLVIDKWLNDWDIEYSGVITLTAGQQYDIKLEYFENNGGANCKFSWSSASQPKEIVPKNQLYPAALSAARLAVAASASNTTTILYPNPAAGSFRLKFNAAQARIVVYDVLGREVIPSKVIYSNQAIDISHLKEGVYLIQMDVNGVRTTKSLRKSGN
jgi:hypothetical protein